MPYQTTEADTDAWARLGTELMDIIHRNFALNATEDQISKRQQVSKQEGLLYGDPSRGVTHISKTGFVYVTAFFSGENRQSHQK